MDEKDDYFRIGEQILTRQMNSMSLPDTDYDDNSSIEGNQINNNLKRDQLYAKCLVIYHFLQNNKISSFLQPISQNIKEQVESEANSLLEIMENEGNSPSIANFQKSTLIYNRNNINSEFFSQLEALNILSFALLLLRNNDKLSDRDLVNKKDFTAYYDKLLDNRSDEIVQHEQLKEKYKRLHANLKEYETVFSMVARKMNLPEKSDFSMIASELALYNFSNKKDQSPNNSNFEASHEDKLRQYLINKFNIADESSSDEIINMIEVELSLLKNKKAENKTKNDTIRKFFIQMMDMPENSDDNDVKIKFGSVLDELQTMKSEINFLNEKLARQKNQNQETLDELDKLKQKQLGISSKDAHVSFDLNQNSIQKQDNKTKISNNSESDVYILRTEIDSLKMSLSKASEKIKTIREQNKQLKIISKESINESRAKTNTITELTATINDLSLKNSELERALNEKSKQKAEVKSLNFDQNFSDAFEYLSSQIEIQSNELSQISEERNKLYKIVHRQEKVIDILNNQLLQNKEKAEDDEKDKLEDDIQINNNINNINFLEKNLISLAEEYKRSDIISILIGNEQGDEERKVLISMDEDENKLLNSIIYAFSSLLSNSEKNPELNESKISSVPLNKDTQSKNVTFSEEKVDFMAFKEVCQYLSSLLVFFDKIANSSETLDWIFINNYYVNSGEKAISLNLNPYLDTGKSVIRETLVNLVQRITYFLEERQIDVVGPDFLRITDSILSKTSEKVDDIENEHDESYIKDENAALQLQRVFVTLTVADVLKNYSLGLQEKIDELAMALKKLKDELVQSEMAMNEAKGLYEIEKRKNRKLMEELEIIESELSNEKDKNLRKEKSIENDQPDSKIESTEMLTNNGNNITIGLNNDSNGFYVYNQAISKNDSEDDKKKLKKCQKLCKLMKKKFEKILKDQEKKINVLSDKIIDTQNELDSTKEVNDQLSKENKEITETLAVMTERLSQFEIEKDAAVTAKAALIENEYEEKLSQQSSLNKKILNELNETRKKLELAEDAQNIENKNLQKENKDLFSKIEEIRSNYETLIKSYKQKYSEFTEREKKMTQENLMQTESLKKMNKELNDARIENKICALRNKTLSEKLERQSSLYVTQKTALSANFEAALNEKLKMVEIDYENRKNEFLKQLFEQLKDFYDFTKSMNEENCLKIISMLVSQLKIAKSKENQNQKSADILEEMKKELHIKSDNELITKVLLLSSLSPSNSSYLPSSLRNNQKNEINDDADSSNDEKDEKYAMLNGKATILESAVKNWRRWANSMNSILSDNFSSFCDTSIALTISLKGKNADLDPNIDSILRSRVEEKILSSVGKRRIFRRIEILRNEKKLFVKLLNQSGATNQLAINERNIGLQTVLCVVICMRRIQKISGKLPSIYLGKIPDISLLSNSSNINNENLSGSTGSYRYSYDENDVYSTTDNTNYDNGYDKSSNSQQQHKKKPIIPCT